MRIAHYANRLATLLRDPHEIIELGQNLARRGRSYLCDTFLPAACDAVDELFKKLSPHAARILARIDPPLRRAVRHAIGPGCERMPDTLESALASSDAWHACRWVEGDTARTWAERFCHQTKAGLSSEPVSRSTRPTNPLRALGLAVIAFFADERCNGWTERREHLSTWRRAPRPARDKEFDAWQARCAESPKHFFVVCTFPLSETIDDKMTTLWALQLALAMALIVPFFFAAFFACYARVLFGALIERNAMWRALREARGLADSALWCLSQPETPEPDIFEAWIDEMGTHPIFVDAVIRSWPEIKLAASPSDLTASAIRLALHAARKLPARQRALASAAYLHALGHAGAQDLSTHFRTRGGPTPYDLFLEIARGAMPQGLSAASNMTSAALMAPIREHSPRSHILENIDPSVLDSLVRSALPDGHHLYSPAPWIALISQAPWPVATLAIDALAHLGGATNHHMHHRDCPASIVPSNSTLSACASAYGARPELAASRATLDQLRQAIGSQMADAAWSSREKSQLSSALSTANTAESPHRRPNARRL